MAARSSNLVPRIMIQGCCELTVALLQDLKEERTRCSKNHFVKLNSLTILADQGDIDEVSVLSKGSEGRGDILLKIVPPQAKVFSRARHDFSQILARLKIITIH